MVRFLPQWNYSIRNYIRLKSGYLCCLWEVSSTFSLNVVTILEDCIIVPELLCQNDWHFPHIYSVATSMTVAAFTPCLLTGKYSSVSINSCYSLQKCTSWKQSTSDECLRGNLRPPISTCSCEIHSTLKFTVLSNSISINMCLQTSYGLS